MVNYSNKVEIQPNLNWMVLTFKQVLHGYRQLVSWDIWSSPITIETLILYCWDMRLRGNCHRSEPRSRVTCQHYYLIECRHYAVLSARIEPLGTDATSEPKSSCSLHKLPYCTSEHGGGRRRRVSTQLHWALSLLETITLGLRQVAHHPIISLEICIKLFSAVKKSRFIYNTDIIRKYFILYNINKIYIILICIWIISI
jgi:hypothetical protein